MTTKQYRVGLLLYYLGNYLTIDVLSSKYPKLTIYLAPSVGIVTVSSIEYSVTYRMSHMDKVNTKEV